MKDPLDRVLEVVDRLDQRMTEQERNNRRKLTDLPENDALLCGTCREVLGWQHQRTRVVRNRCGRGDRVVRIRPKPGATFSLGCERCQVETAFLEPMPDRPGRWNLESPPDSGPEVDQAKKERALEQLGVLQAESARVAEELRAMGVDPDEAFDQPR